MPFFFVYINRKTIKMKKLLVYTIILISIYACNPTSAELASDSNGGSEAEAGILTAGEWNDLENWNFWIGLQDTFSVHQDYWGMYPTKRIAVKVSDNGNPVKGAKVELLKDGEPQEGTFTDNLGNASFFLDLYEIGTAQIDDYQLRVENSVLTDQLVSFDQGVNEINYTENTSVNTKVQLSFIVDATGSMGDELNFLKQDLKSVIETAEVNASAFSFQTSSVFYRDEDDDYLTRVSDFDSDIDETLDFIKNQSASGGGDFPEAVHSALVQAMNLEWDENAHTKIAFLFLDAPPHYRVDVLEELVTQIESAKEKGIKIIPVSASGIDKETEFLLRYMSIITNGTYVFLTDDSGVGNEHLPPSVGEFEVEFLNDLMVRLIKKYTE